MSEQLLQQLLNGISIGALYALVALGYTLVFGLLRLFNLAHGDIFMASAFVGLFAMANGGPIWAALILAAIAAGVLGLLVELVSFRPLRTEEAQISGALSSIAFGIVLTELVRKQWGTEPVSLPGGISGGVSIGGIDLSYVQILIPVVALVLMVLLDSFVERTNTGRAIQATAQSRTLAALTGINAGSIIRATFFASAFLAGVAGMMLALRTGVAASTVGLTFGLKAIAIMAIAGLGHLRGAMIVGLVVGVVEALAVQYGASGFAELTVWIILILTLILRPQGLFGRSPERV